MTPAEGRGKFESELRERIGQRYVDKHPFMRLFYAGKLSKTQMQVWILNRFYLQNNIMNKDAAILSNCPIPQVRRIWMARTIRREGLERPPGDIEGWLQFAESAGLRREQVLGARCLPGVRFAVDELVNFARRAPWVEGASTSLYELLARDELLLRVEALRTRYRWISPQGTKFFLARLAQLEADSAVLLEVILSYCKSREERKKAIAAAATMAEVVWALHDAIYMSAIVNNEPLRASI